MTQTGKDISASMPPGVGAFYFENLESTNVTARTMAGEGTSLPLWVVAAEQSGGKGRLGRSWESANNGNLYTTFVFAPTCDPNELTGLPFVAALAVYEALIDAGARPEVLQAKWPNDILLGGEKLAGILIESIIGASGTFEAVMVGIGVNLAAHPSEAQFPPTALKKHVDTVPEPLQFLPILAHKLQHWLNIWQDMGFNCIREKWLNIAWGMGQERVISTHQGQITGTLSDLLADGALLITLDDGSEKRLYAGDVFPMGKD